MICKQCGTNVPEGVGNCPVCGVPMGTSPFSRATDLEGGDTIPTMAPKSESVQSSAVSEIRINMGVKKISEEVISPTRPVSPPLVTPTVSPKQHCISCGAELTQGARFCTRCGKPIVTSSGVSEVENSPASGSIPPIRTMETEGLKGKSRKKLFIIGGIAAGVLLHICIILIVVFAVRGPEETVEQYIEASLEGDVEDLLELMPNEVLEAALEETDWTEDEFYSKVEEIFEDSLEFISTSCGDDWEYSVKIGDTEKMTNKKLQTIQEKYDQIDVNVKDAATVGAEITLEGEKIGTLKIPMDVNVIKIGQSWYIYSVDASEMVNRIIKNIR